MNSEKVIELRDAINAFIERSSNKPGINYDSIEAYINECGHLHYNIRMKWIEVTKEIDAISGTGNEYNGDGELIKDTWGADSIPFFDTLPNALDLFYDSLDTMYDHLAQKSSNIMWKARFGIIKIELKRYWGHVHNTLDKMRSVKFPPNYQARKKGPHGEIGKPWPFRPRSNWQFGFKK